MTDPIRYADHTTQGQVAGRVAVAMLHGRKKTANQAARRGVELLPGRRESSQ